MSPFFLLFLSFFSLAHAFSPVLVSTFLFSDKADAMACLTSSPNSNIAFAASDGADIYYFPLSSPPVNISVDFDDGPGTNGVYWTACQSNPTGTIVYLLDTRGIAFYYYVVATPSTKPVLIATFPQEAIGALTSFAVDWNSGFAYIGTRHSDNIYTVNVSLTDQSLSSWYAYGVNSDITSLALSPDGLTLYYGTPPLASGFLGAVYTLSVDAGVIPYPGTPNFVVASVEIIWPDSILLVGDCVYIKDGGALNGKAEPNEDPAAYQSLFLYCNNTLTLLYTDNNFNLPAGLILSYDQQSLLFTSTTTLYSLRLYNSSVPVVTHSSSSSSPVPEVTPQPSEGGLASDVVGAIVFGVLAFVTLVATVVVVKVANLRQSRRRHRRRHSQPEIIVRSDDLMVELEEQRVQ